MNKIDFIESMKVLNYKRGDIIVLKISVKLSKDTGAYIKEAIHLALDPQKEGVKFMILDAGMDIGILRREHEKKNKKTSSEGSAPT